MTWRSWTFISWPRDAMLFLITTYTQTHSVYCLLLQTRLCSSVCTSYQSTTWQNSMRRLDFPTHPIHAPACMTMVWFARDFSEIRWRWNSNWEIGEKLFWGCGVPGAEFQGSSQMGRQNEYQFTGCVTITMATVDVDGDFHPRDGIACSRQSWTIWYTSIYRRMY